MEEKFLKLIESSIRAHWNQPALSNFKGKTFLYKEMATEIEKLHILFARAGIRKGDKIALLGRNSAHWAICFFGILSYGCVAVPVLHDFKAENVHHIVNHSETKVLFAADSNWAHLDRQAMPGVEFCVSLDSLSILYARQAETEQVCKRLDALFLEKYPAFAPEQIGYHAEAPEELAILNYTSGTTGFSKGVMIPYRSLWSNTAFAETQLPFVHSGDSFVAILPMAHMYGLAFEIMNGINKGCHIHFLTRSPNPRSIIEAFGKIRPKLIISVPLIIEKVIVGNVFPMLKKPVMKALYHTPALRQLLLLVIRRKLNNLFGGRFFEIVIGGAAIHKEVEAFLREIKFRYTVGYGMTECGPLVAYAQWDAFKQGSVGKIVDRMEVKIESDDPENTAGEILVRGTNNMLGYYKNPQTTAEVMMPDGWMRTGDLGTLDRDGYLFIRGRSKTMILGSNGQNIYPEEIESVLNGLPYVLESLVVSREDKIVALAVPDREKAAADGLTDEMLSEVMHGNLDKLNTIIPHYCKVSSIRIRNESFEKTPKMSIKRYLYATQ
ncbi:MAG: AMP-binding protein [Tannerella sp.]|jgi:long-chain acyl-CoA synthetase|nr:AMP-binding protein [Tannerella sp.]